MVRRVGDAKRESRRVREMMVFVGEYVLGVL